MLKLLAVADKESVLYVDASGVSALYEASQKGHLGIVKALLAADADVNRATNTGGTPLFVSS